MEILITGSADMESERMNASFLIDGKVAVDLPGGSMREMRRLGKDPLLADTVLVTHIHGDHVLDIPLWVLSRSKAFPEEESTTKLSAEEETLLGLDRLIYYSFPTSLTDEKRAQCMHFLRKECFRVHGLNVTRVPVRHGILAGCAGYLVTDGTHTAGFTGDSCMCAGVKYLAENSDILFADCDLIEGNEKHMGIDDLRSLKEQYPSLRIVAVHLKEETRKQLLEEAPEGIEAAEDGQVICL